MNARELGRQAAFLHLKLALAMPSLKPPAPDTSTAGGSIPATTLGAKPAVTNAAPLPAVPKAAPAPAAAKPSFAAGGIGNIGSALGGIFSNMGTPQGLGGILANPALQNIVRPVLQMGGFPLLTSGVDMLTRGGANLGTINAGPVPTGDVKPGVG